MMAPDVDAAGAALIAQLCRLDHLDCKACVEALVVAFPNLVSLTCEHPDPNAVVAALPVPSKIRRLKFDEQGLPRLFDFAALMAKCPSLTGLSAIGFILEHDSDVAL